MQKQWKKFLVKFNIKYIFGHYCKCKVQKNEVETDLLTIKIHNLLSWWSVYFVNVLLVNQRKKNVQQNKALDTFRKSVTELNQNQIKSPFTVHKRCASTNTKSDQIKALLKQ